MALVKTISQYWLRIQSSLFPWLEEELGEMTEKEEKLVTTLELIRIRGLLLSAAACVDGPRRSVRLLPGRSLPKRYTTCRQRGRYWTAWHVIRSCGVSVDGNRRVADQANQQSQGPSRSFLRANYWHVSIGQWSARMRAVRSQINFAGYFHRFLGIWS